jgi:hypothetical protein
MVNHFIKQILLIGSGENSIQTELGNDFNLSFDMDAVIGQCTFKLPYIDLGESVSLKRLKKGDEVKLWFGSFDENPGDTTINEVDASFDNNGYQLPHNGMYLIFDGVIDRIPLSKSKDDYPYEITAIGSLGLGNGLQIARAVKELNTPRDMINTLLQVAGLQIGENNVGEGNIDLFPSNKIRLLYTSESSLQIQTSGGTNLIDEIKSIRDRHSLIVFQSGDGLINITTPQQLAGGVNSTNATGGIRQIATWDFRWGDNIFEIDYGELNNDVNTIICVGKFGRVGYGVDPYALQLTAGYDEQGEPNPIQPQHYKYNTLIRRSVSNPEELERIAKDKLLELTRNYVVSIKTLYSPHYMIGDAIRIFDEDRYPNGQIFFIKKIDAIISKNDVSCTLTVYSNSLAVVPEKFILDSTGVADVDVLDIENDLNDATGWSSDIS